MTAMYFQKLLIEKEVEVQFLKKELEQTKDQFVNFRISMFNVSQVAAEKRQECQRLLLENLKIKDEAAKSANTIFELEQRLCKYESGMLFRLKSPPIYFSGVRIPCSESNPMSRAASISCIPNFSQEQSSLQNPQIILPQNLSTAQSPRRHQSSMSLVRTESGMVESPRNRLLTRVQNIHSRRSKSVETAPIQKVKPMPEKKISRLDSSVYKARTSQQNNRNEKIPTGSSAGNSGSKKPLLRTNTFNKGSTPIKPVPKLLSKTFHSGVVSKIEKQPVVVGTETKRVRTPCGIINGPLKRTIGTTQHPPSAAVNAKRNIQPKILKTIGNL